MKQQSPKEKARKASKIVSNDSKKAQSTMLAKTANPPLKIGSEFVSSLTSEKLHALPMVTESLKPKIKRPKKLTGELDTVIKKKNPRKSASNSNISKIKADGAEDVQKMHLRSLASKGVGSWGAEEVKTFFALKGMPDEGRTLREEQVDGLSLLLLQRSDVLHELGLRVGPALKVYRLIYQLQTNKLESII